ncbi:hypothetical protein B0H16DRAFT_994753 [Mycena metata]|uniref:Uncharacterized protein n=1 Tax=Mycena metata TaxID=1033252 RepID=A0AAD7IIW2_9AGAR|nr:hypothetical protein B0H16DRAFT_994753 [Mycena metata]
MTKVDPDRRSISSSESSEAETLSEPEWQEKLSKLKKKFNKYQRAKERGEDERAKTLRVKIETDMRDFAYNHPDTAMRAEWKTKLDELSKTADEDKDNMFLDIGMGLGLIVASPFILAGGVLYGVGLLTKGLGNLLTGGAIGRAMK